MEPLYCFRLYPEIGNIDVEKITNYKKVVLCEYTGRYCYQYKNKATGYLNRIRSENLDRFVSNKVYTFDPDLKRAKEIISKSVLDRLNEAQAEKEKWLGIYNKLL